jgi:prophage regulatory protein
MSKAEETAKPATTRPNLSELDPDSYLRLKQIVPEIVPIHPGTFWKWVREGKAPAPHKLGPAVTAWRVADLRAFLKAQEAA